MQPTGAAELKIHGPAGVIPTPDGAANDGGDPHANGANGDGAEILSAADLRDLLQALRAVRAGDFSVRLATDRVGFMGKVADTLNEIVAANQSMAVQLERVGQVVGREGRTRQRVRFDLTTGAWGRWKPRSTRSSTTCSGRPRRSRAPSRRWRRATCCRPCGWRWTAGRSRASSCARPRS